MANGVVCRGSKVHQTANYFQQLGVIPNLAHDLRKIGRPFQGRLPICAVNLIYELTSYADDGRSISVELVHSVLSRLRDRERNSLLMMTTSEAPETASANLPTSWQIDKRLFDHVLREGDILLPIDVCILRHEETFK